MNYIKSFLTVVLIMCLISTISFAQEKEMMKKDSMKTMMKDGVKKDMMGGKMMKREMKDKEMMHGGMMKINKNTDGVAIKGYDPVAYFTDGKPVMGDKMYSYNWSGADWHFKNEKHLNMFKENPEKYAPCYGGYCAYGVSDNHLSPTDPAAWTIEEGKLYLNYSKKVREGFKKNLKKNIMKADENWPGLNKEDKM